MSDKQSPPPESATTPTKVAESTPAPRASKSPSKSPSQSGSPRAAAGDTTVPLHPPQHWAHIAAENLPEDDDADSAVGSDDESTTASITSSVLAYRTIQGRTFHAERGNAHYPVPNDEKQNESMDLNHHVLTLALDGKLFLSPLNESTTQKVLDIGTGTGLWAIDFADDFPGAEVIGTDISPIQPSWVPPNLKFEIEDCTQEWTFDANSFDYVHLRYLNGSIQDWAALFREAFRACKPGGWAESHENSPMMESDDGSVTSTSAMNEWGKFFIEGGKRIGRPFTIIDDGLQKKYMEAAGFVDIQTRDIKVPIGGWAKDPNLKKMGQFVQYTLEADYEGYVLFMAKEILGWSKDEVYVYCAQLRQEVRSGKYHPYYRQRVVYGRKPE